MKKCKKTLAPPGKEVQSRSSGLAAKTRNRVAANPLLGKGGQHEKSAKAKRRADKIKLANMRFERAAVVASGQSRMQASLIRAVA